MGADDRQRNKLRASGVDRQRAAEVLATGLREGRLDAREYEARTSAAQTGKTLGELNALLADLPDRLGVRDWAGHLRIRQADREQVSRWLGAAAAEGRLSPEEHDRRLGATAVAGTYAELKPVLDGVPGPSAAPRDGLLVSAGDRQVVLDRLAAALADGLLSAAEHRDREGAARKAKRYRQLDGLATDLSERADPAERANTVRRLDRAHAAGQLDAAEHAERVRAAEAATRDAHLAGLLADLRSPGGRSLLALSNRHRLADAEREQAAQELQHALDDGRLALDEYDERVRKAYAAATVGDLRPLLNDLLIPAKRERAAPVGPRRRRRWVPIAAAVVAAPAAAVVLVVTAGVILYQVAGGPEDGGSEQREPGVLWSAARDRPSGMQGLGSWVTDRLVIRARTDRVVAYALAGGQEAWSFPVPAEQAICTMSSTVDRGIGLVGFGGSQRSYCDTVVAIDLATGQRLWQRDRRTDDSDYEDGEEIALAGGVAVIREPGAFVAVDARANKQKWRLPAAKNCRPYSVVGGGDTVALLTACDDRSARLALVEAGSGRERWHAPLRLSADDNANHSFGGYNATVVLSLDPVVVRTSDGNGAFVSFDDRGQRRATIPQSQADVDLAVGQFPAGATARPAYAVAVRDDVLVVPERKVGETAESGIAGFSLADGRRLWHTDVENVRSIQAGPGTVLATATRDYSEDTLLAVSVADGRVSERLDLDAFEESLATSSEVTQVGDTYVFVNADGTLLPPVTAIGPR